MAEEKVSVQADKANLSRLTNLQLKFWLSVFAIGLFFLLFISSLIIVSAFSFIPIVTPIAISLLLIGILSVVLFEFWIVIYRALRDICDEMTDIQHEIFSVEDDGFEPQSVKSGDNNQVVIDQQKNELFGEQVKVEQIKKEDPKNDVLHSSEFQFLG